MVISAPENDFSLNNNNNSHVDHNKYIRGLEKLDCKSQDDCERKGNYYSIRIKNKLQKGRFSFIRKTYIFIMLEYCRIRLYFSN